MPDTPISREAAIEELEVVANHYHSIGEHNMASVVRVAIRKVKALPAHDHDPRRPPSERPEKDPDYAVFCVRDIRGNEQLHFLKYPWVRRDSLLNQYGDALCRWSDVLWWQPIRTGPLETKGE